VNGFVADVRPASHAADGSRGGPPVLRLRGQLDGAAADTLRAAYAEVAASSPGAVVLDFTEVSYINSTGIAVIVGVLGAAQAGGVEVRVCGVSDHYRHIFEITRLAAFVPIFEDEGTAVAASTAEHLG
jgi:anti-sigma B factor antagonist